MLDSTTSKANAAAYSLAQQLISTAWSILFAIVLMIWVFGWGGGRTLLEDSYAKAKKQAAAEKTARAAKRAATQPQSS